MHGLIVERGYDAITLAEVAAAAGVGRTAVYNHFRDKESVLLAWADAETESYLERLDEAFTHDDTPLDKLRTFLRMQITELAGHHTRLAGIGSALSADARSRIREHVAPMMRILRAILTEAMEAGSLPEMDLDQVVPLINGVTTVRNTVGKTDEELDETIGIMIDFVLHGIGAD